MALYRTYRPQTFADVAGQEHIVTTLEQAIAQKKFSHAYLFAGSRGTGKTSVARILAKEIMTQNISDPVLKQQIIRGVEDGSIVDLLEIDAASNTGVDNIRDLIEKIQFSPVVATAKVYIIDEAHMLSKGAFNALLKTLEEPPAYAHFILATTEVHKIPATIQSRCQCFPFRPVRDEDIVRRLQYIADQERITVDREALRLIARHAEGGMRDAISLLDQMRSLPKITGSDVEQRIGATGHEYIEAISKAIAEGDADALLKAIEVMEEQGVPLDLFLRSLLSLTRDRLHAAIAKKEPIGDIAHVLDVLLAAIRDVRVAPVPGLVVEAALLSLCLPPTMPGKSSHKTEIFSVPSVMHKEKEKEKEKKPKKEPEATTVISTSTPIEEPIRTAVIEAPEVTLETMTRTWPSIIDKATPASVKMSLKNGTVVSVDATSVTLGFASAFHRDKVAAPDASRSIEQLLLQIFKRPLKLHCTLEKDQKKDRDAPREAVVNLAEAAAEIF